jgi:hypothetical protein
MRCRPIARAEDMASSGRRQTSVKVLLDACNVFLNRLERRMTKFCSLKMFGCVLAGTSLLALNCKLASAAEVCVSCSEPAAVYRCAIEGDAPGTPIDAGLQLYCIKELAGGKGHKSCSIDRTRGNVPCDGVPVSLARPVGGLTPAAAPVNSGPSPSATPAEAAAPEQAPDTKAPPPTVEALAKDATEQSKKDWDKTTAKMKQNTEAAGYEIQKAGSAVGGAIKNSWDCLTSLFARC